MIFRNKKVTIHWKSESSYFRKANATNIDEPRRFLGASINGVNSMIAKTELMKELMPTILGTDPNSSNWSKMILNYWNSLSVQITPNGKELEIGFSYDIMSNKPGVLELLRDNKTIKSDEDLANWVEGEVKGKLNVEEVYKIRYGSPITPEDYLLWLYTFNYRDVANTLTDVDKSKNIRFYLLYEGDIEKMKRKDRQLKDEATEKRLLLSKDEEQLDNVLYVLGIDVNQFTDIWDKKVYLADIAESEPERFLSVVNDKDLVTKSLIYRLTNRGILNRLPNTEIIVDAVDTDYVLGNTLQEVVLFFKSDNELKSKKVKEYTLKLKQI